MKFKKFLENVEVYTASLTFAVMLVVILIQVVTRIADHPISWGEELARYLMVWGCCLGIAAGTRRRAHVSIDSIVDHLNFKISIVIRILMDAVELLILAFMFVNACKFTAMAIKSQQLMPAMQQPIWIVYLAFPVGFGFAVLRQVICIFQAVKDPRGRCGLTDEEEEAK